MNPAMMMAIPTILSLIGGLTGDKAKQGSTYTKPQRGTINDILQSIKGMGANSQDITQGQPYQQGNEWLSNLFNDPEFFNSFEAPLQRDFQEKTIPELSNRFASLGSGGALGSTAFRNALGREGSNLHTNIAALRGGLQQQGVNQSLQYGQQPFNNYMSLLQTALQPTQNQYHPASPGFGGNTGASMFSGLAQGYGNQWGQQMAGQYPGTT